MQQDFKSMQKLFLKALTYFILIFILIVDVIIMSKIIARERDKLPCFTVECFNFSVPKDLVKVSNNSINKSIYFNISI